MTSGMTISLVGHTFVVHDLSCPNMADSLRFNEEPKNADPGSSDTRESALSYDTLQKYKTSHFRCRQQRRERPARTCAAVMNNTPDRPYAG